MWRYRSERVEHVQVGLTTNGRPLDADLEVWLGPDNTPLKMRVYSDDGRHRPFSVRLATPGHPNTVVIRNIGPADFPLSANVVPSNAATASDHVQMQKIQGGCIWTCEIGPSIDCIYTIVRTDGNPLNARLELLQGPNNNKQVVELYSEDGLRRPFGCVLMTPGAGSVVRVVNTAPVEFPLRVAIIPRNESEHAVPTASCPQPHHTSAVAA